MNTVPTLCATATALGASTVGLVFGREISPDQRHDKDRRPLPNALHTAAATTAPASSTSTTPSAARPSTSTAPPISRPLAARPSTTSRLEHHGRQRRLVRRMTTTADPPSQQLHTGSFVGSSYSPAAGALDINEPELANYPPSSRASWIKRLSVISTSQASSRDTSPHPLSPSISCSNGSMAFSHDGSTVPMIGERPPPPLPPNKLVKRSSSVQGPRDRPPQSSASRLPSFRRPATSHQRSATLQHQTALLERTVEHPSVDEHSRQPATDSDVEYTHFFTARVTKEKTLTNGKTLKKIFPDQAHKPTLLLARSVSTGPVAEVDDSASDDSGSVYLASRPGTPPSIPAVIATPDDPSRSSDSKHGRPSTENAEPATRSRRSFSITDLLSSSNTKKQRAAKSSGTKIPRRSSQKRLSFDPQYTMDNLRSRTAHGDGPALRDLIDPALVGRDVSTSSGPANSRIPRHRALSAASSSPLPGPPHRTTARADPSSASMHLSNVKPSAAAPANQHPPSPTSAQTGVRPSRSSMAPSEQASTLVGSDNDARGAGTGDDDDADVQSETAFDSLRTGATRSTSGARGPRIETIFDESPPSKVKVTALRDLLPKGTFREQTLDAAPGQQSIAEEEELLATPVRTIVPDRSIHDSPTFSRGASAPLFPSLLPSSPPDMPMPLNLGTLEWDSRAEDDESSGWSTNHEDEERSWDDLPTRLPATPPTVVRRKPQLPTLRYSPKPSTPLYHNHDHVDRDTRSSIFDWSEQQPADPSAGSRTPPRPSTVHGKKDADRRGSRAVGRRATSGLHARSQSVPVVPDATGKRNTVVTNKFGTWGVGSKGVTEDWNDDFDFSDVDEESSVPGSAQSQRVDSGVAMIVPDHIQEQQNNVLANIGLLREWGLLIEELKEQRARAASLDIRALTEAGMWEEVDAMIDLADQEAEHEGVDRLSPPSSPGFDEVTFEDVSGSSPIDRRKSGLLNEAHSNRNTPSKSPSQYAKRRTILPPNDDIFGPHSSPVPPKPRYESPAPAASTPAVTRPRKDSEAKARSVIEALQKRKSIHEVPVVDTTRKVPFDTATLRRIVPYVSTLTRKVKDALREAEGLYSTPRASPNQEVEISFNRTLSPENDVSTQMKLMTVM